MKKSTKSTTFDSKTALALVEQLEAARAAGEKAAKALEIATAAEEIAEARLLAMVRLAEGQRAVVGGYELAVAKETTIKRAQLGARQLIDAAKGENEKYGARVEATYDAAFEAKKEENAANPEITEKLTVARVATAARKAA